MNWNYNEWEGDGRWDDKQDAIIEALRAIAEQLERLNDSADSRALKDIYKVSS